MGHDDHMTEGQTKTENDRPAANPGTEAPPAATAPPVDNPLPADRYLNRELSWLDFNNRVLTLAADTSLPLLERAKFLAIFASNLDEFYMVRVAGLKRRDEMGLSVRSADGLSPREQLRLIGERTRQLAIRHAQVFLDSVRPALAEQGIRIVSWSDLTDAERSELSAYFSEQVFPVLTPLAVDPAHPFPFVSGLSLNLAVAVRSPSDGAERFARVKVPDNVDRFVRLKPTGSEDDTARFLPMEDFIAAFLPVLFPGMEIVEQHAFRITRNADMDVEDRDEDLLQALERELARRRFGPPVRLEVSDDMSEHMLGLLLRELDVHPGDIVQLPGLLDLSALWQIYAVDRPALKDRPFVPATHPAFAETGKSIFAALRDGDILVHHPYESFSTSVQRFIEQAAADPDVLAIKQNASLQIVRRRQCPLRAAVRRTPRVLRNLGHQLRRQVKALPLRLRAHFRGRDRRNGRLRAPRRPRRPRHCRREVCHRLPGLQLRRWCRPSPVPDPKIHPQRAGSNQPDGGLRRPALLGLPTQQERVRPLDRVHPAPSPPQERQPRAH